MQSGDFVHTQLTEQQRAPRNKHKEKQYECRRVIGVKMHHIAAVMDG